MPRLLIACIIAFCWNYASGQSYQLVHSGEVLKRASVLSDSGKFDLAIKELLAIPNADTNYFAKQRALVDAYLNHGDNDKVIALSSYMSRLATPYRAHFLWAHANALGKKEQYDQALTVLTNALKEYPFDVSLRYRMAATYHNKGSFQEAIEWYFKVLEIAPFQSSSHLNLGRISALQGRKTHALMSLSVYMALEEDDNPRLRLLDNVCGNKFEGDGSQTPTGENAFEEIDLVIRAEIALNKKFKSKIPVDAPVVKQMELLFQQLQQGSFTPDDPWVKQYLPIFKKLIEAKQTESFIYFILSSAKIEAVDKWKDKNKKALEVMFDVVNSTSKGLRSTIPIPESLGKGATASTTFNKDGSVDGIGNLAAGKNVGDWIYYFENGVAAARGNYENGTKKGIWKYYRDDGSLKSVENEDNGFIEHYNLRNQKTLSYTLVNKKAEGEVVFYTPAGTVSERLIYKGGKREGAGTQFFPDGKVRKLYKYQDDLAIGTWTTNFVTGKVSVVENFVAGKLEGPYQLYWENGKTKTKGSYKNDELDGDWATWHSNGELRQQGVYSNGKKVGVWKEYDRHGTIQETISYNQEGDEDGETIRYAFGKLANKIIFAKGKVKQLIYYDETGKELAKFGSESGAFSSKKLRPSGSLYAQGEYKNGSRDGTWVGYYPSGIKRTEFAFNEEKMVGAEIDYDAFGTKKSVKNRKAGELDGLYQTFYSNGQVEEEGWYVQGQKQQEWRSYYSNGVMSTRSFYLNGSLRDTVHHWGVDGNLDRFEVFVDGNSILEEAHGKRTPIRFKTTNSKNLVGDTLRFPDGKLYSTYRTLDGVVDGVLNYYYPDGTLMSASTSRLGWLHGATESRLLNGIIATAGMSVLGDREGVWTFNSPNGKPYAKAFYADGYIDSTYVSFYDAGAKRSEATYSEGSQHGLSRTFAPDGTLVVEWWAEAGERIRYRVRGKNGQLGPWTNVSVDYTITAYYPSGVKALEQTFKDGSLTGTSRSYYPDGKVCEEYSLKNNDYHGLHTSFYPNGKVCRKVNYVDDLEEGLEEWYNPDGTPARKATFHLGVMDGPCTYFGKDGKPTEVMFYNGFLD